MASKQGCDSSGIRQPIAICGIALRLPGGITNPAEFWDFLLSKSDAISKVPNSRYNISSYYSESDRYATAKTEYGYFLDDSIDIGALDTSFFSFTKNELEYIDPQQRQLLEVVRECFENAGEVDYCGKDIGCYVGSFGDDWIENLYHDLQMYGKYTLMTGGDFALANRVSYEYDLRGPNMSIRTACSSALVCLHEACSAIERGECSAAVVAGCNLIMSPSMSIILSAKGVLAPDGCCKSFDAEANGYGRGEAINAIFIKPLQDALRDGNMIRGVITGTAVNSDGKSSGVNAPNAMSQESLIRKAYSAAGIADISETAFVECHGTGTAVGDPIEAMGVSNAFGPRGTYIGSVKPNVGHSEGASGLTALIKAAMALENQIIPPNIKFQTPNPKIPFESMNLKVPTDPTPWPQDRCLRASVNAFGMGGVNAHVIVESPLNFITPKDPMSEEDGHGPHLLLLSANSSDSLERLSKTYHEYAQNHSDQLKHLAYTLGARREHLPFRTASVIDKTMSMRRSSSVKIPASPPKIIMVFTGQGAQWPRMGIKLYEYSGIFREAITSLDAVLHNLPDGPDWFIADELGKDANESKIHSALYAQPLCTAIQIALVDLLRALNVTPHAVIGHSSGELAAAYAVGGISASQAIIAAFYRGLVSEQVTKAGAMVAVNMGSHEAQAFLVPGVVVACDNSPSSVTLSGDKNQLENVVQLISSKRPDMTVRQLKVDVAYHSHHMREVGGRYKSLLEPHFMESSTPTPENILFYSTLEGSKTDKSRCLDSQYWQHNLECPVRFHEALKSLAEAADDQLLFLSIGPHPALWGPVRQILENDQKAAYVACLNRATDCAETFLSAMGQLYCHGVDIDFNMLTNPTNDAVLVKDLPTYPWDHSYSKLYMPRENREWRWCKFQKHELLGIRVIESTDKEPSWRNVLHLEHVPWLRDHRVMGAVVFPAAGYISIVESAFRQLSTDMRGFSVRNMVLSSAMVLSDLKSTEIITSLRKNHEDQWYSFTVSSHDGTTWTEHCYGSALWMDNEASWGNGSVQSLARQISPHRWYKALARAGLDYGPAFRGVSELCSSTTQRRALATVIATVHDDADYFIHPTRLDAFFQTVIAALHKGHEWQLASPHIPIKIGRIDIRSCQSDLTTKTLVTDSDNSFITANGQVFDCDGGMVVRLEEAVLQTLSASTTASATAQESESTVRLYWQPDIQFRHLAELVTHSEEWACYGEYLHDLTAVCIERARSCLREQQVAPTIPHLVKYHGWLEKQPEADSGIDLDLLMSKVLETPAAPCAVAMMKVLNNIVPILQGSIEPLQVLMSDNTLLDLYDYLNMPDRGALFSALGFQKPGQRILEIGAGTGGTTAKILQDTQFSTYTFTDISPAFFPAAKERFKQYRNMTFKTLDITKDPLSQGFEPAAFDLIIAANVLHATPCLKETLTNVHRLLHPNGKLLLEELCSETKFTNFVTGVLPGWWDGDADGRPDEPYVSPARWDIELKKAGFNGVDDLAFDAAPPYHVNAYMFATPCMACTASEKSAVLIHDTASAAVAMRLRITLQSRGYAVLAQGLDCRIPQGHDVLVLLDTRSPFFQALDQTRLQAFQRFLTQLQQANSGALWVTQPCQLECYEPHYALSIGVARTVRSESGVDFATCEVDELRYTNIGLVADVFEKFRSRSDQRGVLAEQEYIITDGVVHVGRMLPFPSPDWLHSSKKPGTSSKELATRLYKGKSDTGQHEQHHEHKPMNDHLRQNEPSAENEYAITDGHTVQNDNTWQYGMRPEKHGNRMNDMVGTFNMTDFPPFQPNSCYLLVGGLGGLGSALAKWMVENDARHLIFLSRSAGETASDKSLFMELRSQGCHVLPIKGSICKLSDVQKAISSAKVPLKGIFNLSMVLQDASLLNMTLEQWNTATEPKVEGTWNLHWTSLSHTLDFFVLFSSMCGIFGMPGQANYAAANAFMDAFVQYRHQCHLPASVLDLGAVEGIGHVAENPHILERSSWLESVRLSQKELFDAVRFAVLAGSRQGQTGTSFMNATQIITAVRDASSSKTFDIQSHFLDRRFSSYIGNAAETTTADERTSGDELSDFLRTSAGNRFKLSSSVEFVATQIAKWVFDLLLKPVENESEIDISRSLADVSFDSLAAVEMRAWWRKTFGLEISVLEIMSSTSFAALGEHAVSGLIKKL